MPDCTYFPSLPDRGEVLLVKSIEMVGSSTEIRGRALGASRVQMVSPISTSSIPARMIMSPGWADSTSFRLIPSYTWSFEIRSGMAFPSPFRQTRSSLRRAVP